MCNRIGQSIGRDGQSDTTKLRGRNRAAKHRSCAAIGARSEIATRETAVEVPINRGRPTGGVFGPDDLQGDGGRKTVEARQGEGGETVGEESRGGDRVRP